MYGRYHISSTNNVNVRKGSLVSELGIDFVGIRSSIEMRLGIQPSLVFLLLSYFVSLKLQSQK